GRCGRSHRLGAVRAQPCGRARDGQRGRNSAGGSEQNLRSLLHYEGGRGGYRAGTRHQPADRSYARWQHRDGVASRTHRVSSDSAGCSSKRVGVRESSAELGPEEFRALGHDLVDRIAELLRGLRERPVAPDTSPARIRSLIGGGGVPEVGEDPKTILDGAANLLFDHSTFNGHPRFFGYITSSASPIGALADLLAASVNANVGAWQLSPVATEIERQTVRWVAELIGFPADCGGIMVSGGNMANMVCLMAALRSKATWDMRQTGTASGKRLVLYASEEVHTWLHKGADMCGLGLDSVRAVAVDGTRAMVLGDLRRQIAADRKAGLEPAFVVGTAGSGGGGGNCPVAAVARVCRAQR